MAAKILVTYLAGICYGQLLHAQVSPKASVSKKPISSTKHNASRSSQHMQASLLQGVWSICSDCNAEFTIKGSRVIFFDPETVDKPDVAYWKISNNKFSFIYKNGDVMTDTIIKLTKDSLVLYRRDKRAGVIGYSRYIRLR